MREHGPAHSQIAPCAVSCNTRAEGSAACLCGYVYAFGCGAESLCNVIKRAHTAGIMPIFFNARSSHAELSAAWRQAHVQANTSRAHFSTLPPIICVDHSGNTTQSHHILLLYTILCDMRRVFSSLFFVLPGTRETCFSVVY